jgi:hypothetical protein
MKKSLITIITMGLLLIPFGLFAESDQMPAGTPPVAQSLIPEGDFALKLAPELKLGTPDNEAQAEDMLTSVGIAPRNGWIADYPVTPDILGELQNDVAMAADSKKLPMVKDEALNAFQNLISEFGLAVTPGSPGNYAQSQPQPDPTVINNYYYEEGPPVVTYYPPPWDYDYLYAWVPYPFWYSGFFFSGFFVLHDFNIVVAGHHGFHHSHLISNHFTDLRTHSVFRIDPRTRMTGRHANPSVSRFQGFNSTDARKGASSIFERSHGRQFGSMNPAFQSPSRGQVPANRGAADPSTIDRANQGFRSPSSIGSQSNMHSSGQANIQRPSEGFSRSSSTPRSFSTPSFSGRGSSGESHTGSFGGFHGGSFGGSHGSPSGHSFSGGFSHGGGGGCRGRC